ncbi:MAG: DUF4129 domain-containing protein [Chloroflexota bacterium]
MKRTWRQSAMYVAITGMELSWLYVWIAILGNKIAGYSLFVPGLLMIYGFSFGLNKLLDRRKQSRKHSLALNIVIWFASMLIITKIQLFAGTGLFDPTWLIALPRALVRIWSTFEPVLLVFFTSIILWIMGFRLAKIKPDFTVAVADFQVGLAFLLVAFLVGIGSHVETEMASSVMISLAFIAFALLGMAIAHGEQGNSWLTSQHHAYWAAVLFTVIIIVSILGLVIGFLVTPSILEMAIMPFKLLWGLIVRVMFYIANLDFWKRFFLEPVKEIMGSGGVAPMETPEEGYGVFKFSPDLLMKLRFLLGVLWIAAGLIAIWRIFSVIFKWLRRMSATAGAQTESLDGAFKEDLLSFLKRILRWLFRIKLPFLQKRVLATGLPEVAAVREIYRQMLSWAAANGWPRVPFQTPYEYLNTLEEVLPLFQVDLDFITNQYVRVRYGLLLPDEIELGQLQQSWYRIRHYEETNRKSSFNRR